MQLLLAIGISLCVAGYSGARQEQTGATAPIDPFYAPDVYGDGDPSVTSPSVVTTTRPNYTSAAMRHRIEGVVRMIAIVERDGKVTAVRITRSLDPAYGLDASAVETMKRWRFKPAIKDGVPVRARIEVEMSFRLGATPDNTEAPITWPAPFHASISPLEKAEDAWTERPVAAGRLRLVIRYPNGWTQLTAQDDRLFISTLEDARYPRAFMISQPVPAQAELTAPLTDAALNSMADHVKKQLGKDGDFKLVKAGQVRAPERLWFWAEMTRRLPQPTGGQHVMHLWVFTTTEQRDEITVFCSVVEPDKPDTVELREQLNRAGADFAAMITRLEIGPE